MRALRNIFYAYFLIAASSFTSFAQGPTAKAPKSLKELLGAANVPDARCQGKRFTPCVCPESLPKSVSYRAALDECGGRAAVILRAPFLDSFSVVVRDKENNDRWPPSPSSFGGCTRFQRDELGLNRCSAFKVQRIFFREENGVTERVNCLGASGNSSLFKRVVRITTKISNRAVGGKKPIVRWCLKSPGTDLN